MIKVSEVISTETNSPLLTKLNNCYSIDIRVTDLEIDGFGHVNNANYIQWLDQVHWSHLNYIGISSELVHSLQCGFVVRQTDVTYFNPLIIDDVVKVGCSIVQFDAFRLTRKFQLIRLSDGVPVLKGEILYVSIDLTKGKVKRIPVEFISLITPHAPLEKHEITSDTFIIRAPVYV